MASRLTTVGTAVARQHGQSGQRRQLATSVLARTLGTAAAAAPTQPARPAKPSPKDLGFGNLHAGRTRDFSKIDLPMPAAQNINLNARGDTRRQHSPRPRTQSLSLKPKSISPRTHPKAAASQGSEAVDFYENSGVGQTKLQPLRKRASFASISNDVGMDLPTGPDASFPQNRAPRGLRGPGSRFGPRSTSGRPGARGPGARAGGARSGQRRVRFGDRNEGGVDLDAQRRVREIWAGARLPQPKCDRSDVGLFGTTSVINAPIVGGRLSGKGWDHGLSPEQAAKQQALRLAGSYATVLPAVPRPHDAKLAGKPFEQAKAAWSWHMALNRSVNETDSAERIRAGAEIVAKYTA